MNRCRCWLYIAEGGVSGEEVATGPGVDDCPLMMFFAVRVIVWRRLWVGVECKCAGSTLITDVLL